MSVLKIKFSLVGQWRIASFPKKKVLVKTTCKSIFMIKTLEVAKLLYIVGARETLITLIQLTNVKVNVQYLHVIYPKIMVLAILTQISGIIIRTLTNVRSFPMVAV